MTFIRAGIDRIGTKQLLRILREAMTVKVLLSAEQYRRLTSLAAQNGDTPDQAVRQMIEAYCSDLMPETRRPRPGRWSTEPTPFKPRPRSSCVLEQT